MAELSYVYHYDFVHNVMSNFFKDTLDYLSYVYPRFEYRLMGTYDKAVSYINSQTATSSEIDKPNLPAIILDPSGDFQLADPNTGSIQHWRFPNLASGLVKRLFNPIYMDEHVRLSPGFTRLKGNMEVIILLNSFYEYTDVRILLMQLFAGFDRWTYPVLCNTFIVMPDDLINYQYANSVTGETYTVDWASAGATQVLVKTTNRNEWVFPVLIKPIMKMTGLSDGSEKYGGTDGLTEWKLNLELEYELEVPSFMIVETDFLVDNLTLNIHVGSEFSIYEWKPPTNRMISHFEWETGIVPNTNNTHFQLGQESIKTEDIKLVFKRKYFYQYTSQDVDSTENLIIPLEEPITRPVFLILNSVFEKLEYWDHWDLDTTSNSIILKVENVNFNEDEMLEINVYEPLDVSTISHSPVITSVPDTVADIRSNPYVYNITAYDSNPDDVLVFSLDVYPSGMILNPSTGRLEWNVDIDDLGFEQVSVRVTDSEGSFDTQTFTLEILDSNQAPYFTSTPTLTVYSDSTYMYNAVAEDDQPGIIYSLFEGPVGLTIDSTSGLVGWQPDMSFLGENNVTIKATDIHGLEAEQTFILEVLSSNDPPVAIYKFNDEINFGLDTIGNNNLTTFGVATTSDVDPIEGRASAYFPLEAPVSYPLTNTGAAFYRFDSDLSSDFPLKNNSSNNEMTFTFWFKSEPDEALGYENCTVFCKGRGSRTDYPLSNDRESFQLLYNSNNERLYVSTHRMYDLGGFYNKIETFITYPEIVEPFKLYHISITFNTSNKELYMRVYNKTDEIQLNDFTYIFPFAEPFLITDGVFSIGGRLNEIGDWMFHGLGYHDPAYVDDFWVFNKRLNPTQLDQIRLGTYTW